MSWKDSVVRKFVEQVLPRIRTQLKPELVILFGSRARGTAHEGSDIDIIVVAEAFEGMHFLKRMPFMMRLARFPHHIDFLCYTPAEFEQIQQTSTVINEALREGFVLYSSNSRSPLTVS
jgi:predicted nucleotidyltransferase